MVVKMGRTRIPIYDKNLVDVGSLTFQQFFDHLSEKLGIEVTLVSAGNYALYNGYLPGNKHKDRLAKKIEEVFSSISDDPIPEGRNYL